MTEEDRGEERKSEQSDGWGSSRPARAEICVHIALGVGGVGGGGEDRCEW